MPPKGGNDGEPRQQFVPRVSSEVVTRRPTIVEDGTESTSSAGSENDGGDESQSVNPDILRLLAREPGWANVILSIYGCARTARVSNAIAFFHRTMLRDSEDMDLVRGLIPNDPDDPDSLRENLALIVKKSLAFDEATRKSGLGTHDRKWLEA